MLTVVLINTDLYVGNTVLQNVMRTSRILFNAEIPEVVEFRTRLVVTFTRLYTNVVLYTLNIIHLTEWRFFLSLCFLPFQFDSSWN